ncbi:MULTISPECIES: hypothetical protein [unclassified Mesorhizobium]|uniref:hypothetical protein n=1 Tax=unclassified Mesorhizobium TaxID=325217 RepID=UPI00112E15E9|nr:MULTISPECIES: hypothetical protein [unclassified Mesorhizobium]MBZ9984583.1 hypothetical protein [Mesorhizobium sp. BR-1-1-8]TPL28871.1 hypothetical protein FJ947_27020 [Mesorhizobium sp. B2-4-8]TPL63760.1 hypothetical protein FJ949_16860 [Mesorhizobium sp. B2-4-1]
MKSHTLEQLHAIAQVDTVCPTMTRNQRLERWASLLERHPERRLGALPGTEYMSPDMRENAYCVQSPISVAFEDPILRAQGLEGDTYGEAKRFFELSNWQLHNIVCDCHVGATMKAGWVAVRVRAAMGEGFNIFARLRALLGR